MMTPLTHSSVSHYSFGSVLLHRLPGLLGIDPTVEDKELKRREQRRWEVSPQPKSFNLICSRLMSSLWFCSDVILTTPVIRVLTSASCSALSRGTDGPGLASSIRGRSSAAGGTTTRLATGLTRSGLGAGARTSRASPPLRGTEAVGAGGAWGLEFTLGTLMLRLPAGGPAPEVPACVGGFGTASPGAWLPRTIRWPASGGPSLSGAAAISTAGGITGITWRGWGAWAGGWAGAWARGWGSIWMRLFCLWKSDMGCSRFWDLSSSWGCVMRAEAWMLGCWGTTNSFTSFAWMRWGCGVVVPPDCVDVPGWDCVCVRGCADEVLAWGLSCEWVLVLAFSWVFDEELAQEKCVVLVEVLAWGSTVTCAEEPACGCTSPDVLGWGCTCVGALDVVAFVEVDGVWIDETAWSSTVPCAVPSCCCEFVLSFGWDSVCDEEPGSGCVCPKVLDCTGVRMARLAREEWALASLEVEGAEPGSPEVALLWPTTWIRLSEAPLHFAAGRITCLRAGVNGCRKHRRQKRQTEGWWETKVPTCAVTSVAYVIDFCFHAYCREKQCLHTNASTCCVKITGKI